MLRAWLKQLLTNWFGLEVANHGRQRRSARSVLRVLELESRLVPAINFGALNYVSVGNGPMSVVAADFNKDGNLDLASAEYASNTVTVSFGKGDGTFKAQQTTLHEASGAAPSAVAVGDFNKDGNTDLVVANMFTNTIGVRLGNGDGTFKPETIYGSYTHGPTALAVGNFDGKNGPDIAIANLNTDSISILLNNGDGTFHFITTNIPLNAQPSDVAVADFNKDGKADLVVSEYDTNKVAVLLGNGDGTFKAPKTYNVGSQPSSVTVADFDGNGTPDLVVTNTLSAYASVFLNKSDGTGNLVAQPNVPTSGQSSDVAVADFKSDGKLDLAVTNGTGYGTSVQVFAGNGDGTFTASVSKPIGPQPWSIVAVDLNNDGRPDLVAADKYNVNAPATTLGVLLNTTPTPPPPTYSLTGSVFVDLYDLGTRDADEPGQANATVYLDANNNGTLDPGEKTAITDANGNFTFANLPPGTYSVGLDTADTVTTPPVVVNLNGNSSGNVIGDRPHFWAGILGGTLKLYGDDLAQNITLKLESGGGKIDVTDASNLAINPSTGIYNSVFPGFYPIPTGAANYGSLAGWLNGGDDLLTIASDNGNPLATPSGGLQNSIDGGGGTNTLYGPNASVLWSINGPGTGSMSDVSGNQYLTFFGMSKLVGGNQADGFAVNVFSAMTIDGGSGADNALAGPNSDAIWSITAANTGTLSLAGTSSVLSFSNVGKLTGGTQDDWFAFSPGGSLSVSLTGNGGGDWLDYSNYGSGVTVNLGGNLATGIGGSNPIGAVTGIRNVLGSSSADNITGGSSPGILIGGDGGDTIKAGTGNDILIGGAVDFGPTPVQTALMAISKEWQSSGTFSQHVSNITSGNGLTGGYTLVWGTTVKDDGVPDTLTTGPVGSADWFFGLDSEITKKTGDQVGNP